MRLKNFINEDDNRDYNDFLINNKDDIVKKIKSECSKWLSEIDRPVYRGMKGKDDIFFKGSVRKDRTPVDMPDSIHNYADKVFKDLFGWKARSEALFVAKFRGQAVAYGTNYVIFPIGNYKYIYSDNIPDFFSIGLRILNGIPLNTLSRKISEGDKVVMNALMDIIIDSYTDKGLKGSDWITGEVMVKCDSYYAIEYPQYRNTKVFIDIMEELGVRI